MRFIKNFLVLIIIIFSLGVVVFVADKFYKQKLQTSSLADSISEKVIIFWFFDLNYLEKNKDLWFAMELKKIINTNLLLDSIHKLYFTLFEEQDKLGTVLIVESEEEKTFLNSLQNWQVISVDEKIYSNGLFYAQRIEKYTLLATNLDSLHYFIENIYLTKTEKKINSLENSVNYHLVMNNFLQKDNFLNFYFDWTQSYKLNIVNLASEKDPLLVNLAHVFQGIIKQGAVSFFAEDDKLKVKYFNLSNSLDISRLIENVFTNQEKSDILKMVPANIDFLYQSYNLAVEFANLKNFIKIRSESDFIFLNSFFQNLKNKYAIDLEKIIANVKYDYAFFKRGSDYAFIFKIKENKEKLEKQLLEIKKTLIDILAIKYPKIEEISLEDGTLVKQLVVNNTAWHEVKKEVNGITIKELTLLDNSEVKYYTAFVDNYFIFTKGFDLMQQTITLNELKLTDVLLKDNLPEIGINLMEVFYFSLKKLNLENIYFADWWDKLLSEYDYFVFGKNIYNEGSSWIGVFY